MKSLQERGHKAMKIHNYDEAIRLYNEALEIDDQNVDALIARANAYMVMEDFINAQKDAESLIAIQQDKPQVEIPKLHSFFALFESCKSKFMENSTAATIVNSLLVLRIMA